MIRPVLKSGRIGNKGGTYRKVNPFMSDEGLWKCSGAHLDEAGTITKWQGFSKYNLTQLLESAAAKFTGLFDFAKSDQIHQQIATALQGVYRYGNPSANIWNALSLANVGGNRTGTVNDYFDFVVLKDLLYIFNGIDSNLKYDGTTIYNMGIAAPASAPTAASGGAGALTGGYSYKVTFYNSALGHESNPSAASNTFTASSNQISLTGIPVSTDAQVNRRRIYRTTTDGGVWLFRAEISDNTTTTFTDNAGDSTLGIEVETFANGVPPVSAMAFVSEGFVFMVPKNSSRIYFSKNGFPNAVDSNDFRELDPNDGDVITGINRLFSKITAFKNDSIWNGSGTDRFDMAFTKQVTGIGSVNHKSILVPPNQNRLLFLSEGGFYSYDGVSANYESVQIEPIVRGLNKARLQYTSGFVYKPKNVCCWLVSDQSSTEHNLMILYDFVQDQWFTRPMDNVKANIGAIIEDSTSAEVFYIGGYDGFVRQGDSGLSDDGAAITMEVIDRAHPKVGEEDEYFNPETVKCFYELILFFEPQAGTTVAVSYKLDTPSDIAGDYTAIGTANLSASSGQVRLRFNATGKRFYPRFFNSAISQPVALRGWQVKYKDLNRVY